MPLNPTNFKYAGTGGRGQQQLARDPTSTGVAIIHIEDKSGGADTYSFRLEWQGYAGNPGPFGPAQTGSGGNPSIFDNGDNSNGSGNGNGSRRERATMSSAEAVEACQQEIMRVALQRFNTNKVYFRRTAVENNRGGQDQVRGTIDVSGNNNASARYKFSCGVNLNNGRIRAAQIDASPAGQNARDYGYKGGNYDAMGASNANRVIQACETAADRRLTEQGMQRVGFGSVDIDDRTGNNRVFGTATVNDRNQRQQTVDFSCNVNLQNGTVTSVDAVARRLIGVGDGVPLREIGRAGST
ncbi:MAG: hypothetical protein WDO18_20470 [Acidobacteriota bacterium]